MCLFWEPPLPWPRSHFGANGWNSLHKFLRNNWSHVSVAVRVSSILKVISCGQSFPVILWLLPPATARAARWRHYATGLECSHQSVPLSLSQTALDCGHMDSASTQRLPLTWRGEEIWLQLGLKACKMFARQKSRGEISTRCSRFCRGRPAVALAHVMVLSNEYSVALYKSKLTSKPKKS